MGTALLLGLVGAMALRWFADIGHNKNMDALCANLARRDIEIAEEAAQSRKKAYEMGYEYATLNMPAEPNPYSNTAYRVEWHDGYLAGKKTNSTPKHVVNGICLSK